MVVSRETLSVWKYGDRMQVWKFCFAVGVLTTSLFGQQPVSAVPTPPPPPPPPGTTTILLWPSGAPGAQGDEDINKPTLTIFLPSGSNMTKTGVIVAPGGGY